MSDEGTVEEFVVSKTFPKGIAKGNSSNKIIQRGILGNQDRRTMESQNIGKFNRLSFLNFLNYVG